MNDKPEQPLISIVTVNFNGQKETDELLKSLRNVTYKNTEVIVVDNGSGTPYDPTGFPEIKFIRSEKNLGFSGGNNLGIKAAEGEHILLLNNDTEVEPGFLEPLVETLQKHQAGLVSPKIIFHHSPGIIQYAGCTPIHPVTSRGFAIGFGQADHERFAGVHTTSRAHGAAMLIHGDVLKTVGLLPEVFFLYYEEMDYCEAVKKAGYEIWFDGRSVVYHKESMSVGKLSNLKVYYMNRNRWLFVRRNTSGVTRAMATAFLLTVVFPKEMMSRLLKADLKGAQAVFRGFSWNLFNKAA